jgi:hypothetical protein
MSHSCFVRREIARRIATKESDADSRTEAEVERKSTITMDRE